MYLPNNPTLHKTQADLEARTWSLLKEVGDLTLIVQQFDFLYENYSVYHNAAKEDSLAFRFHSDGVRELTLREGLEPQELRAFVEVLKRATDPQTGHDDMVTLLWERDFRHVQYLYIPIEDIAETAEAASAYGRDMAVTEGSGIPWPTVSLEAPPSQEEIEQARAQGVPVNRSDDWTPLAMATGAWDESSAPSSRSGRRRCARWRRRSARRRGARSRPRCSRSSRRSSRRRRSRPASTNRRPPSSASSSWPSRRPTCRGRTH
jgi:hypothetical protein